MFEQRERSWTSLSATPSPTSASWCADLEASIAFYTQGLGFRFKHRAPGFADFTGAGLTLALWERRHIGTHAHVPVTADAPAGVAMAVRLDSVAAIDSPMTSCRKGVAFVNPPARLSLERALPVFHRS